MKKTIQFHKNFTLNGKAFENVDGLLAFSKTISVDVATFLKDWFDANNFVNVQTSGSTGKPTNIQLKKKFMINSALATGDYFDIHEKTKALLCLSPNYIAGKMMLVRALVLGWQLDVVAPNSHPLNGIITKYDFCAMIPMQLYNSIDELSCIKQLIVGGGAVSNDLQKKLEGLQTKVFATYGMTETVTHIAVKKLNYFQNVTSNTVERSLRGRTTWQSLKNNYKTLPNIKITTDNRDCLIINASKVSDSQIITNDIVELISETEFKWLGRYDTIINSGGVKLIPEQIEKRLSAVIDRRFFVAGIPDKVFGEKLVLIIEDENYILNNEIATSRSVGIRNDKYIQNFESLSKFEIPKEIYIVKKFVETETKKIQRQLTLDLIFKNNK